MLLRGNWEITRQDLNDSQILTLYPSERDVMHPHDDDYSALGMRTTVCCQSVAIIVSSFLFKKHFCRGTSESQFCLLMLHVI